MNLLLNNGIYNKFIYDILDNEEENINKSAQW